MTERYNSSREAEAAFYRAFEQGDLAAMVQLWDEGNDIVCVHPMSSALRGARDVMEAWREILSGGVDMRFAIEEIHISQTGPIAIHIVKEHIAVPGGKPVAPMTATNVYRETAAGWRMILHHSSPSPGIPVGRSEPLMH